MAALSARFPAVVHTGTMVLPSAKRDQYTLDVR